MDTFWVWNWQEGSDSERESNDASSIPQKSQKRKRGKHQLGASKEDGLMSWSMASTDGCLSLLKRVRSDGNTLLFRLVQKEQIFGFSSICYFSYLCS